MGDLIWNGPMADPGVQIPTCQKKIPAVSFYGPLEHQIVAKGTNAAIDTILNQLGS